MTMLALNAVGAFSPYILPVQDRPGREGMSVVEISLGRSVADVPRDIFSFSSPPKQKPNLPDPPWLNPHGRET